MAGKFLLIIIHVSKIDLRDVGKRYLEFKWGAQFDEEVYNNVQR